MKPSRELVVNFDKHQLIALIDAMSSADEFAKEKLLTFFELQSKGMWHNRARAKIARRLKHLSLTPKERCRCVDAVGRRLLTGEISEQFKDQLKMAIELDIDRIAEFADKGSISDTPHIVRFSKWVLAHRNKIVT